MAAEFDPLAFARRVIPTLNVAGAWALAASGSLQAEVKQAAPGVERSPIHEAVSSTDFLIQEMLLREIRQSYPEVGLFGEEQTFHSSGSSAAAGEAGSLFVAVDPLDGSYAYLRGARDFAIMLTLFDRRSLRLGIVHLPGLGETFVGAPGVGVFEARYRGSLLENPYREGTGELVALEPEPFSEEARNRWAVHYRFLREPFAASARRLAARGVTFATLEGGQPDPGLEAVELGSNGSLIREVLHQRLAGYLGPFVAFHDVAPLAALLGSCGAARFYQVSGAGGGSGWRPKSEQEMIAGFLEGTDPRTGVILVRDERLLKSVEESLLL